VVGIPTAMKTSNGYVVKIRADIQIVSGFRPTISINIDDGMTVEDSLEVPKYLVSTSVDALVGAYVDLNPKQDVPLQYIHDVFKTLETLVFYNGASTSVVFVSESLQLIDNNPLGNVEPKILSVLGMNVGMNDALYCRASNLRRTASDAAAYAYIDKKDVSAATTDVIEVEFNNGSVTVKKPAPEKIKQLYTPTSGGMLSCLGYCRYIMHLGLYSSIPNIHAQMEENDKKNKGIFELGDDTKRVLFVNSTSWVLVFDFLINVMKLVSFTTDSDGGVGMVWNGSQNSTRVVHLGNQLATNPHDVNLVFLTDYLNYVSDGRFISIYGGDDQANLFPTDATTDDDNPPYVTFDSDGALKQELSRAGMMGLIARHIMSKRPAVIGLKYKEISVLASQAGINQDFWDRMHLGDLQMVIDANNLQTPKTLETWVNGMNIAAKLSNPGVDIFTTPDLVCNKGMTTPPIGYIELDESKHVTIQVMNKGGRNDPNNIRVYSKDNTEYNCEFVDKTVSDVDVKKYYNASIQKSDSRWFHYVEITEAGVAAKSEDTSSIVGRLNTVESYTKQLFPFYIEKEPTRSRI
jgi:hypothetical protein